MLRATSACAGFESTQTFLDLPKIHGGLGRRYVHAIKTVNRVHRFRALGARGSLGNWRRGRPPLRPELRRGWLAESRRLTMKRLAAITLMAAVAGGCAMLEKGSSRARREVEISASKEATPKTSPFEALACRVSSRRAKAVSAKEAVVQSEDSGPVLPEAKPSEEKSVSVITASASAGTP